MRVFVVKNFEIELKWMRLCVRVIGSKLADKKICLLGVLVLTRRARVLALSHKHQRIEQVFEDKDRELGYYESKDRSLANGP